MKDENLPITLCWQGMTKLVFELSIQHNCLPYKGQSENLVERKSHLYDTLKPQAVLLITVPELKQLYRTFEYLSVGALYNWFRSARSHEVSQDTFQTIKIWCTSVRFVPLEMEIQNGLS